MSATIKDVAKFAGVSFKTVSRVMNDDPAVTRHTRLKVQDAVEQLGYRPHLNARQLRTQRSNTIGFVTDEIVTTPHAVHIIKGAQRAAWERKKLLLVINTERDLQVESEATEMLLERRVDGIIYATMYHREIVVPKVPAHMPVVLLDCFDRDHKYASVVPDEFQGGYLATETLLEQGHTRVGFINVDNPPAAQGRLAGYFRAHADKGLATDDRLILAGNSMADMGQQLTQNLMALQNPPTALFCGNDRTAMGAYNALARLGLNIPNDIAVIGFDNEELIAAYLQPPLTTAALPHAEMGRWAVETLLTPNSDTPPQHKMSCPLIKRDSV